MLRRTYKRLLLTAVLGLASVAAVNAQSVSGSISGGPVSPGKPARATVYLDIPGGLHANSSRPNSEFAIPTNVRVSSGRGVRLSPVNYPRGHNKKFGFSEQAINVYEGRVPFTFTVTVPQNYAGKSVRVNVTVRYQACTDEVCYSPKTKSLTLTANVR